MLQSNKKTYTLAVLLAALAGYVDALGFISIGGFFVSFMSGNSTRLGIALSSGDFSVIIIPLCLIFLFVVGVVAGSLMGHFSHGRRFVSIMSFVTLMLGVAALLHESAGHLQAMAATVIAMGAINTLFERNGEVSIAVTYMTGTLVRMGQWIANMLLGGSPYVWLRYFVIWAALVAGACLGAFIYTQMALDGIWIAVIASCVLTLLASRLEKGADATS
jgi:uncharacterized membrane protein YoaK (UPF0700 family)